MGEIDLPDTLQAIVLSDDKYKVLTDHNVWPHFVNVLVPRAAPKIMFFAQMMGSQGQDMGPMVRQWVPSMLQVMRESVKQGGGCGMFGGRHRHRGRGRGCHRGRGRGFGRCGRGNWNQWGPGPATWEWVPRGAHDQMNEANQHEEEMEEVFEYTEEMVAIMNMGFSDMAEIKRLLKEHHGNKQNVVQELVAVQ